MKLESQKSDQTAVDDIELPKWMAEPMKDIRNWIWMGVAFFATILAYFVCKWMGWI